MKATRIKDRDTEVYGKTIQALLLAALAPSNFSPFLKKILDVLSAPEGLGRKASLAIVLKAPRAKTTAFFRRVPAAGRRELLSGPAKSGGKKSLKLYARIPPSGYIAARPDKKPQHPEAAARLLEMAADIIRARMGSEKRDAELAFERDLSSSVKHVEELYLSYPGMSVEEISRAVLDEARRMTCSSSGFVGYIDPSTGRLTVPTKTRETGPGVPAERGGVIFSEFMGLWGWVLKRKRPLLTNTAQTDKRSCGVPRGHLKIERFLGVPAICGSKLLGILVLTNPAADYGPAALETAEKLARVYAMILQRKLEEDRQRAEEARFRAIMSSSKDIILTQDLDGKIIYMSPRVRDYGYRPEEMTGRSGLEYAHPEDREFLAKAITNAVKTGKTLPILPYRIRKKDGSYINVEQKSGLVFKNGKPVYITGVIRDVTEQRVTERLLKESETMMRMVFETATDAIFIKDMNGMYVKVNKACADLMNTTPEAMIGHTDSDYFPPETAAEIFRTDSEVVRTGKTLSVNNHHPFPAGKRHVNAIKTPLKGFGGETIGLLGIARDITVLKKMEAELALARAAEAVSEVARPMAHDFNNALAAINGYATLIDDDLPQNSPIKTEISRIIEAVGRAAELTSKFQDFARNPRIDGGDK